MELKSNLDFFRQSHGTTSKELSEPTTSGNAFRWRKHYFLPRLVVASSSMRGRRLLDVVPAKALATAYFPGGKTAPYARSAPRIENEQPGHDDWRKVLAEGPAQPPRGDVALLNNVSIVAGGVIIADDGRVVAESLLNTEDWAEPGCFSHRTHGAPEIDAQAWFVQRRLSGRVHVMLQQTFDSNYGHWLLEGLPRLVAALKHCDPAQCRVIVSKKTKSIRHVYTDSLAAFGINPEQIVRHHRRRVTHVDQMIYPLPISRHPFVKSPEAVAILESIPKRLGLKETGPKRLYVLRGRHKRRLLNEQALLDILLPLGFETVDPIAMSFADQVSRFSGAEIIVGNCGASLTNAVFAPRGVVVFALTTQYMHDDFFWDLADLKQGRYFSLHGKARNEGAGMYSDFEIDLEAFQKMLAESLAATK